MPSTSHQDFLRLGAGSSLNGLGMTGEQVVIGLLVFQIGGSSTWVGISLALYFAPMFFCGAPAGALADTVDRRRVLVGAEFLECAVLLGLGAVITLGGATLPWLMLFTLLSGTVRAFHHPAKLGYAFDLAGPERAVSTLARLNVITRLGQLSGAGLAGWLGGTFAPEVAIFAMAGGHALGGLVMTRLRTPGRPRDAQRTSPWETMREFLHELRHNVELRVLVVVVCAFEVFGYSYMTLLPEIATTRLGMGAEGLGLLHGLRGLGGLLSGLALSRAVPQRRNGLKYLGAVVCFGAAMVALGAAEGTILVCVLVTVVAACAAVGDVMSQSIIQLCVPDRLRGRAMGIWVLAIGTGPIGHVQVGALASAAGLGLALTVNGTLLLMVGVGAALFSRRLRHL